MNPTGHKSESHETGQEHMRVTFHQQIKKKKKIKCIAYFYDKLDFVEKQQQQQQNNKKKKVKYLSILVIYADFNKKKKKSLIVMIFDVMQKT